MMENPHHVEEFSRERLMEDIRQYPCIYDKFDKDYPDKNAKNSAWAAIAAKYGITPMDADKKYKTMRSSYTRYLKKKRNTPPGAKPPPLPVAFVNLDWLAAHIDHKETAACMKYVHSNGKSDSYYSDYLTDGEDAYHSSYGEIMREEKLENSPGDIVEVPSSNRTRDELKPEQVVVNHVPRENVRPDPLPSPILHVTASDCQLSHALHVNAARENHRPDPLPAPKQHATTPESTRIVNPISPISKNDKTLREGPGTRMANTIQTSSNHTAEVNGPKSITMYYNKPRESTNDTVLNLIPLESAQPSSSTSSESSGKRKRPDYDDEDELFCLSLIPTLKRLGPRNKTIAKMRFQQVLFDLEFPENE